MLYASILLAQVAEDVAKKGREVEPPWWAGPIPMLAAIVGLFYFLIILPGRKERQQRQAMLGALKKNDRIVTNGGIIGVVVNLKEGTNEVMIKSEDTKLLVLRSSIAQILGETEAASTQIKPV